MNAEDVITFLMQGCLKAKTVVDELKLVPDGQQQWYIFTYSNHRKNITHKAGFYVQESLLELKWLL